MLQSFGIVGLEKTGCSYGCGFTAETFDFAPFLRSPKVQGASMWARLGAVHVAGWLLSIISTAAVAKAAQVTRLSEIYADCWDL